MTTHALLTVLNEAPVIVRCVSSAINAGCSAVIILDTGCTDDTIDLARAYCEGRGVSFYSRRHAWHGYANARNVLLDASRDLDDRAYSLMLDADEVVSGAIPDWMNAPGHYVCRLLPGNWENWNVKLTSNAHPWRYVGAVHEVPMLEGFDARKVRGFELANLSDGKQGTADPEAIRQRYERDAMHFRELLDKNPSDSRAAYYYAQSLKDSGNLYPALRAFGERACMEHGFAEERYLAAWYAGLIAQGFGWRDQALQFFRLAVNLRAWRMEAWASLVHVTKDQAEIATARSLAREGGREDLFLLQREFYLDEYWEELKDG